MFRRLRAIREEDIIEPPVTVSPQGTINVPTTPGIGYEVNEARLETLQRRGKTLELGVAQDIRRMTKAEPPHQTATLSARFACVISFC